MTRGETARRRGSAHRTVRLFEHDPDLLDGVDAAAAKDLTERTLAIAIDLPRGRWNPRPDPERFRGHLGLLVLEGLMERDTVLESVSVPEFVGPGDVLRPWQTDDSTPLPYASAWNVVEPAMLAVIDERVIRMLVLAPTVLAALFDRAMGRTRALSVRLALTQLKRVDARLLVLFWHLADRWGRVSQDGVLLPLALTHELLARLVGARRPTVTTALSQLARDGRLERRPDGWLLSRETPALLAAATQPAAARPRAATPT